MYYMSETKEQTITLRVMESMKQRAQAKAAESGVTLSLVLFKLLKMWLDGEVEITI